MPKNINFAHASLKSLAGKVAKSCPTLTKAPHTIRQGLWRIADMIHTHIRLIGLFGAIMVFAGTLMLVEFKSPFDWDAFIQLLVLADLTTAIVVFRPHSGKFIMITGISIVVFILYQFWNMLYPPSEFLYCMGLKEWGILIILVGSFLLCYAGSFLYQFNWSCYLRQHLSWKGFLTFGLNSRIRVYCYLVVLLLFVANSFMPDFLIRQSLIAIYDSMLKPVSEHAACQKQAIAIKYNIIDVFHCKHDIQAYGKEEKKLLAETGLAKTQLQQLSDQHNLMPLVTVALKLHCLPKEVTTVVKDPYTKSPAAVCSDLWHANMKLEQEFCRKEYEQFWLEENQCLAVKFARPREFLHVSLWNEGWDRFTDGVRYFIEVIEIFVTNTIIYIFIVAIIYISTTFFPIQKWTRHDQ